MSVLTPPSIAPVDPGDLSVHDPSRYRALGRSPQLEVNVEIYNGCERHCTGCVVPLAGKRRAGVSDLLLSLDRLAATERFAHHYADLAGVSPVVYHLRYGDIGRLDAQVFDPVHHALGSPAHLTATIAPTEHAARPGGFAAPLVGLGTTASPALIEVPYDPLRDTPLSWLGAWTRSFGLPGTTWDPFLHIVLTRDLIERLPASRLLDAHIAPLVDQGMPRVLAFVPMLPAASRGFSASRVPDLDAMADWLLALADALARPPVNPLVLLPFTAHCLDIADRLAPVEVSVPVSGDPDPEIDILSNFHVTAAGEVGLMDYAFADLPYGPLYDRRCPTTLDDPDGPGRLRRAALALLARRAALLSRHPKCRGCAWRRACAHRPWDLFRGLGLDDSHTRTCWALPEVLAAVNTLCGTAQSRDLLERYDRRLW